MASKYGTVTILVEGPGGCVNYDAELIKRCLEDVGYRVDLKTDYSIEEQAKSRDMTVHQYMKDVGSRDVELLPVKITVRNNPWGG